VPWISPTVLASLSQYHLPVSIWKSHPVKGDIGIVFVQEANPVAGYARRLADALGFTQIHQVVNGGIKVGSVGLPTNLKEGVAILARHHGIPFYVAAPSSTFDLKLRHGEQIPIEQRDGDEIRRSHSGADQMHATELAVEEWNAKGGILGRKIEWVSRDAQLNGAVAHLGKIGDRLTIMSFTEVDAPKAKKWTPRVIVLGAGVVGVRTCDGDGGS
jgi:hypothetical protein